MVNGVPMYYFGCWAKKEIGHYLWSPMRSYVRDSALPFRYEALDGLLPNTAPQSKAVLLWFGTGDADSWTILLMGDYSADTRPGSNAAFIAKGRFCVSEMITLAKEWFPAQTTRIEADKPIYS